MAINFPSAPTVGQTFTASGVTWTWDGYKWSGSGIAVQYLPLSGGALSGDLVVNSPDGPGVTINGPAGAWAAAILNAVAGQGNRIEGTVGGNERWEIDLGNGVAETGGNSGSNFQIARYSDIGALIDTPLVINRASGLSLLNPPPPADNSNAGATTAWVGANALSMASGFVNKFRNGDMTFWSRGNVNVASNTSVYTADGWVASANGAIMPVSLGARLTGALSRSSLAMSAAAGLTDSSVQQRIESYVVAPLAGRVCTTQFRILNNMASAITPTLNGYSMNSQDVASPNTLDFTTSLQTIPAGATAIVAYTGPIAAAATNGYILVLGFAGQLNASTGSVVISDADFRATPGWPTGLTANPPIPEQRPLPNELIFNFRYYQANPLQSWVWSGYTTAGSTFYLYISWPVQMRATPSITASNLNTAGGFPAAVTAQGPTVRGTELAATASSTLPAGFFVPIFTASAEL